MKISEMFIIAFLSLASSGFADAGSIEVIGTGEASTPPEYTTVRVSVVSICYNLSRDAKNANAVLANKLISILQPFVRTQNDKITASGGHNIRQTEYITVPGGNSRVLCERKWRATNSVVLQTESINALPEIQDAVLSAIDEMEQVDPSKVDQTYAELMQPIFHVYGSTMQKLEKEAHGKAWDDAKAQFEAFQEKCKFLNPVLKTIATPIYSSYPKALEKAYSVGGETPIIPDNIFVRATWRIVWEFDPTSGCRY